MRSRLREADRTVQVAGGVDLDDSEAGVLCVLGADAAIVRTASSHLGLPLERALAGLAEALDLQVAPGVAVDDRFKRSVVGAPAAQDHPALASSELSVEHGA